MVTIFSVTTKYFSLMFSNNYSLFYIFKENFWFLVQCEIFLFKRYSLFTMYNSGKSDKRIILNR